MARQLGVRADLRGDEADLGTLPAARGEGRVRKFVAGVVVGLVLAAGSSRAEWGYGDWGTLKQMNIELQRIANALDRLVSMEAQRLPAEKRPQ